MRVYRVTWVAPHWRQLTPTDPGHPLYLPVDRQGAGRFDNPDNYVALYVSLTPEGAVGESFANMSRWTASYVTQHRDDAERSLVSYDLDDGGIIDLDDAATLVSLALRPSDVVRRNRDLTQELALRLWRTREQGTLGVKWWSYWRPEWQCLMLWSSDIEPPYHPQATVHEVQALAVDHPAVQTAADVLPRLVL